MGEGLADEPAGYAGHQRDDEREPETAASTSVRAMVAAPSVAVAVANIVRRGGGWRVSLRINGGAALRGFHVWVLVNGATGTALRTVPIMEAKGYAGFSPP